MPVLWQRGAATVREVYAELNARRPLAYTTILTTMIRLHEKGLLRRAGPRRFDDPGGPGRTHLYVPHLSRRDLAALALQHIVDELLDGDATQLEQHLASATQEGAAIPA